MSTLMKWGHRMWQTLTLWRTMWEKGDREGLNNSWKNLKALLRSSGLWQSALFMWKDPPSTWTALPRAAQTLNTGLRSCLTGDFLYFVAAGPDSFGDIRSSFFQIPVWAESMLSRDPQDSPGIPRKPGLQGSLAPWTGQLLGFEPLHCWTTLTNRSWKQTINSLLIKKPTYLWYTTWYFEIVHMQNG